MNKERQSGIYSIQCTPTGKVYIGSSVDIPMRWGQHRTRLLQGKHDNAHLQYAWNKHGADSFTFNIVELVSSDFLLDREQHWMDTTQCHDHDYGYNISEAAGRVIGDIDGRGRPTIAPELHMAKINITLDRDLLEWIDSQLIAKRKRSQIINELLRQAKDA